MKSRSIKRRFDLPAFIIGLASVCVSMVAPSTISGQAALRENNTALVDYTVATVNEQLITYSDVVWQLALQPNTPIEPARSEDLQRGLSLLIVQRLILQEANKLPNLHGDDKEVEAELSELVRHFSSQTEFRQRMIRVGLNSERLREIVHDRVDIEKYLDFRFRSFVVVRPKEIESYYTETYLGRFRARSPGAIVPWLEQMRTEIEKTLTEEKIEASMAAFLEEVRQKAEIVILRQFSGQSEGRR